MIIDINALNIIKILEKNNYEAYLVGGCVRDLLLGKMPNDWDITTSALPEQIFKIFEKDFTVFGKGRKHGTIGVKIENIIYEVTTFRIDKEYKDFRRPKKVYFTENLKEDLKRRDFTINAMAMDSKKNIVDLYNGKKDLKEKIIKTVGYPDERFKEDSLRILRAIRFSTQLNFKIEEQTFLAIIKNRDLLKYLSADRVREEFNKILMSENPSDGIKRLVETKTMKYIIPEIEKAIGFEQKSPFHSKDIFEHTLDVIELTPKILEVRLSAFFHDIGKTKTFTIDEKGIGHFYKHNSIGKLMTIEIMKRLNYNNKIIKSVSNLVNYHMSIHDINKVSSMKKLIRKIGEDSVQNLIYLYEADKFSTLDKNNTGAIERFKKIFEEAKNSDIPISRKELKINGNDLIELGIKKGPNMSKVLNELLEYVIENPEENDYNRLKDRIKKRYFTKLSNNDKL